MQYRWVARQTIILRSVHEPNSHIRGGLCALARERACRQAGALGVATYPAGGATANPDAARSKSCASAPKWQAVAATANSPSIGETVLCNLPIRDAGRPI